MGDNQPHAFTPDDVGKQLTAFLETKRLGGVSHAISTDTPLRVDSLNAITILAFIESAFGVAVPFEDVRIEDFATVATMMTLVQRFTKRG